MRAMCLAKVRQQCPPKPVAPTDWAMHAKLACICKDCYRLRAFLRNAQLQDACLQPLDPETAKPDIQHMAR